MAKQSTQNVILFDPAKAPFRGQQSAVDPGAIPPGSGYVTQAVNFRFTGTKATVRYGIASDKSAPDTGTTFLGGLNNEHGKWVACVKSGAVRIYQWDSGGGIWQEISDATTRLTDTSLPVHFTVITERVFPGISGFSDTNNTFILWQNSKEVPRIRNAASSFAGAYVGRIHTRFTEPYTAASMCQPRPLNYFNTQAITARTNGGTAGASSATTAYSGGGAYETFTFTTGVDTTSWAKIQFTSAITLSSQPKQLHIVFKTSDAFLFTKMRVSIVTGSGGTPASTEYVCLDPATNPQALVIVPIDDVYSMAVIGLETVYDTSLAVKTAGFPATQVDALKFQWRDSAPSATTTIDVYYCGFGAGVRWGTDVKCSYFGGPQGAESSGSGSRAESRGVLCRLLDPPTIKEVGGTPIRDLRLPKSEAIRYRLSAWTTKREGLDSNATSIIWYIRVPGGLDFYQIDASPTSMNGYSSRDWITKNIEVEDVVPRIAPSELYESVPIGACSLALGERLVVGNARPHTGSSVSAGDGEVWFSAAKYPLRFSRVVEYSDDGEIFPESPVAITPDNSRVQRLATISATNLGADPVVIFTSNGVYSVDGSDASEYSRPYRVSPYGTRSPWSVAVDAGTIFYLDTFRQVRSLLYGSDKGSVSRWAVDDKLAGIPDSRIAYASGAIHDDKYYLAFTPNGGTENEQILIYDLHIGGWYTDSTASSLRFERLTATEENAKRKLFFFHTTGAIYQHENSASTSDSGTAITARIRFGEINAEWNQKIVVEKMGAVADVTGTQKYITTRRYTRESSVSPNSGRIDLYNGTTNKSQVIRYDRDASSSANVPLSPPDMGVRVDVETDALSGFSIYALFADVRTVDVGPDKQ